MRHSSLILFVIRKPGLGESCSLLDCHIFFTQRESIAFELSEVVRKCLVKQTMSPIPSKRRTLLSTAELQQQQQNVRKRQAKEFRMLESSFVSI